MRRLFLKHAHSFANEQDFRSALNVALRDRDDRVWSPVIEQPLRQGHPLHGLWVQPDHVVEGDDGAGVPVVVGTPNNEGWIPGEYA